MLRICQCTLLLAALISPSLAQATPKVGDYAHFETWLQEGVDPVADYSREILQANAGKFLERSISKVGPMPPEAKETWNAAQDYLDDATIQTMLNQCVALGGRIERIKVAAGTFTCCKMPFEDDDSSGFTWITKVPFGMARIDTTTKKERLNFRSELKNYR